MLEKGYGFGSAISIFIATNVCEDILWSCFSPLKQGKDFIGAFIALFDYLINEPNKIIAIRQAFMRSHLPNLMNVFFTVIIFLVVNFFQGFVVNIAIHNQGMKGNVSSYPIKLFYTSNMPIIL